MIKKLIFIINFESTIKIFITKILLIEIKMLVENFYQHLFRK